MSRCSRHPLRATLLLLACAVVGAGCGGDDAVPARTDAGDTRPDAAERGDDDASNVDDQEGDGEQQVVPQARAAAIDRGLDALVAAYAPVSARANYLVTAETLRRDAAAADAGDAIELERAGAVRVELGRMEQVLRRARPRVADVPVASDVEQRIQRQLLQAIDARARAVGELERALDGVAGQVGDTVVEQRFQAWRESWDLSLRSARAATTAMQDERARAGLEPAPEESFR